MTWGAIIKRMKIASYVVQPVRVTYDETVSGTHVSLQERAAYYAKVINCRGGS
jgi:hypothetical protein